MQKELFYKDEKSDKFWKIDVSGNSYSITYGKAGSKGRTSEKSFDTDDKCLKDAEKQIKSKKKKGYFEEGETPPEVKDSKKTAPKKAKSKAKTKKKKAELRKLPPVSDFAKNKRNETFVLFDPEWEELYNQGYPNLVLLDDKHRHNKDWQKWTLKAYHCSDPQYDDIWPTEVALAYVHTYPTDAGYDKEDLPEEFQEKWDTYIALEDKTPTIETARTLVNEFLPSEDTYNGWSAASAFYILEHYIGSKAVAEVIIERFSTYTTEELELTPLEDGNCDIALRVLGFMLVRMQDDDREETLQNIAKLIEKLPDGTRLKEHLGYFPDKPLSMPLEEYSNYGGPWFMGEFTVSSKYRWKNFEKYGPKYTEIRDLYLDGLDRMLEADLDQYLYDISKHQMKYQIKTLGEVKHPYTVKLIVSFGKSKSMKKEVTKWMGEHQEYVDSILPMFADDEYVQAGLKQLQSDEKPMKKIKDPLAETQKLFDKIEKQLPELFKDQDKLNTAFNDALEEAREIARMVGDDHLENYYGICFEEFPSYADDLPEEQFDMLGIAYEFAMFGD